jgi:hypothetical protein
MRVVLGFYGKPLVFRIYRGSLGHGPRLEHPINFKPKIEV